MVRLCLIRMSIATLALIGARPVYAAPITLTGNVETDFSQTNPNVQITPVYSSPLDIGESSFIPANGWVSGWAVKDIRTLYNAPTDTMYVGIDTFKNASGTQAIVGDADGNGNPSAASTQMAADGGVDTPNLGGHKSVTVAFAPDGPKGPSSPGIPVVVAGVPADKSEAGKGTDGFTVASYKNTSLGIEYNYGATLTNNLGSLAFNPSAQHPGFEFSIPNFSKIPGLNPQNGYWISLYAGSTDDVVAGESSLPLTRIPLLGEQNIPPPPTQLPEPTTLWVGPSSPAAQRSGTAAGGGELAELDWHARRFIKAFLPRTVARTPG